MHKLAYLLIFIFLSTLFSVNAKNINTLELIELDSIEEALTIELNGQSFNVLKKLGSGNTTKIFEIEKEGQSFALRVPKGSGSFNTFSHYRDYINAYEQGHHILESQKLSIPKLYGFQKDSFLIVEKLNLKDSFDLQELFFEQTKLSKDILDDALDSLDEFAKEIAPFKTIKDFHLKQALYIPSQKKWRLMDWTLSHELFDTTSDKSPLATQLLKSAWESEVFYRENPITDLEGPSEFELSESIRKTFERLDEIVSSRRAEILETEEIFFNFLREKIEKASSAQEYIKLISETPENFSNQYVHNVLELISKDKNILSKKSIRNLPKYLYSDNKNYINLLDNMISKDTDLESLLHYLELRENISLKLDWSLEFKIQKLITENNKDYPVGVYKRLLDRKLVTNYAKAWIKREFLESNSKETCSEIVKLFL